MTQTVITFPNGVAQHARVIPPSRNRHHRSALRLIRDVRNAMGFTEHGHKRAIIYITQGRTPPAGFQPAGATKNKASSRIASSNKKCPKKTTNTRTKIRATLRTQHHYSSHQRITTRAPMTSHREHRPAPRRPPATESCALTRSNRNETRERAIDEPERRTKAIHEHNGFYTPRKTNQDQLFSRQPPKQSNRSHGRTTDRSNRC